MITRTFIFLMIIVGINVNLYATKGKMERKDVKKTLLQACHKMFCLNVDIDKLDKKIYEQLKKHDESISECKDFTAFYELIGRLEGEIGVRRGPIQKASESKIKSTVKLVEELFAKLEKKLDKIKDNIEQRSDCDLSVLRNWFQDKRESLKFAFENLYKVYVEPVQEKDRLYFFAFEE